MSSHTLLSIIQITISVFLIASVLLQQGGQGVGGAFGGGAGGVSYHTKRGFEKKLFIATIVLGVLFAALAVTSLLASR